MEGWTCPKNEPDCKIKFRCAGLQKSIGAAIRPGNILEIFGEAGSAKTQFCLDLALQTTTFSSNGRVMYVTTDRNFPTRRMQQLLDHTDLSSDHLDRIIVKAVWDTAPFMNLIESAIPELARIVKLDLIIIDSIAGALRSEFEEDKRDKRAHLIHKLGNLLHDLANNLNIPIIVTNQATAVIDQKQHNFGRNILPCLGNKSKSLFLKGFLKIASIFQGLSWTCYVHTRIFLTKTGQFVESDQLNINKKMKIETSVRQAQVDFSPVLANMNVNFIVDNAGIRAMTIKK